jgi:Domain of unknown function (DUF397)
VSESAAIIRRAGKIWGDDWRTSSYSGSTGSCVETASGPGVILVRDSTNRDDGSIAFAADVWRAFAAELKKP